MPFVAGLLLSGNLDAQSLPERTSLKACTCLASLRSIDSLEIRFKQCVGPAMAAAISEDETTFETTVENIQVTASQAFDLLPSLCPSVRRVVVAHKTASFYSASPSEAANRHYEKAVALTETESLKDAAAELKRAIREDDQFVLAIDHLGMCYRRLNELREATGRYKKSLEIFPEGEVALTNIAAIYLLQNDPVRAIDYYDRLIFFHPDSPEGYYGRSRSLIVKGKYEEALTPMCQAHVIYVTQRSDDQKQSESGLAIIHKKLKSSGKEEFFHNTTLKFGIQINTSTDHNAVK